MEVNKSSDITGVMITEDIVEGRLVLLTTNPGFPGDLTGRPTDVPGAKLPDTPAEAARATYCITWPRENRKPPLVGYPTYPFALRRTFDQTANMPATVMTYLTDPGLQESLTIPSGNLAIGFSCCGTEITLPSGQYVYDPTMQIPGTRLRACDTLTDGAALAGMPAVVGSGTAVAEVSRFTVATFALTFRMLC